MRYIPFFPLMWYNCVIQGNTMSSSICQSNIYNTLLMICFDCDTFLNFTLLPQLVMIAIHWIHVLSPVVCLNDIRKVLDEKWLRAFEKYLALVGNPCERTPCYAAFIISLKSVCFPHSQSSIHFMSCKLDTKTPLK